MLQVEGPLPGRGLARADVHMPLIPCPECGRQVSTAGDACPGCGHPNRPVPRETAGRECYDCPAAATTRCQACGALNCAVHLRSIYIPYGRGGAYELRCPARPASAIIWKAVGWAFGAVVFAIILLVILSGMGPFR